MKKLSWLSILLVLTGCTNLLEENVSMNVNEEFYASIETSDSRTYIDEKVRLRWNAEDCITIFNKTTYNREYVFTGVTGANAGGFRQKSVDDDFWYGVDVPYNYAVYPHSSTTMLDESDLFFSLTLPSEQTYVENSFGYGANTMVAVSENGQLNFKNIGSFLRVSLYGANTSVSSITLTSKGEEAIAGAAKVTAEMNGEPTCELTGTSKTIRLVCSNPVTISSNAESPTDFWIVVPSVTLQNGFSVSVEKGDGTTKVFDIDRSFTFERNKYYDLKRDLSTPIPYVTFTAENPKGFKMTLAEGISTLQYSVNDGDWQDVVSGSFVTFGGENGVLRLRGNSSLGTGNSRIEFAGSSSDLVSCTGDIRTLLDYANYATVSTSTATFSQLFCECDELTTAPELPSMELAESCYIGMFWGCTNLVNAPKLPAVTLAKKCYSSMFAGCTKLTTAPEISAITVAEESCAQMFSNCTSLTTVPDLHATELAEWCFNAMFAGCTNLVKAPLLPAQTLAPYCYAVMFAGCTSLSEVTMLATDISAENCLTSWVDGVSSTGIFTKASSMNSLTSGASGVPEGWTVVNR